MQCKALPELRVIPWDSADFFEQNGYPIVATRDGLVVSRLTHLHECQSAEPRISRIDPALGILQGGTAVTVYGTGFRVLGGKMRSSELLTGAGPAI